MKSTITFGSPGTGKTYNIIQEINTFKKQYRSESILVLSHTKIAAKEITERVGDLSIKASTIHSLSYRLAEVVKDQVVSPRELRDFSEGIGIPMKGVSVDSIETTEIGDDYISIIGVALNRMLDPIKYYKSFFNHIGNFHEFEYFYNSYRAWKATYGLIDFNDMIIKATEILSKGDLRGLPPFEVLLIDEAQDNSVLQWNFINHLLKIGVVKEVSISGDPDQCQPAGTLVSTSQGNIPIESLTNSSKVTSYSRLHSYFGDRRIKVTSRPYRGNLILASTPNHQSRYTPNHKCMVKLKKSSTLRMLYLMEKGGKYRIGECKAFKSEGGKLSNGLYPVLRMRQEKADKVWILKIFSNKQESYSWEQVIAAKFGIPQTLFNYNNIGVDSKSVTLIWELIEKEILDFKMRALQVLDYFGKKYDCPHIKSNGGTRFHTCFAVNLMPEIHQLAEKKGDKLCWVDFEKQIQPYIGLVYSLDVEKTGTYIADGIYTHNSLFSWGGADPDGMNKFMDKYNPEIKHLAQSYRVPVHVHQLSNNIISKVSSRYEKSYLPTDNKGEVKTWASPQHFDFDILLGMKDVLILYRNHSLRREIEGELVYHNLPYTCLNGKKGKHDNEVGRALKSFFQARAGGNLSRQEVSHLSKMSTNKGTALLNKSMFQEYFSNRPSKMIDVPLEDYNYYSKVDFLNEPGIKLSTIHGAKGMEAETIILLDGMTQRVVDEMEKDPDSEHRVWYVAVTRTKNQLFIINSNEAMGYQI